jgi:hypothetical protein
MELGSRASCVSMDVPGTGTSYNSTYVLGASEVASGSSALRRASSPHGPSPLLGSGPVTYVRFVMRHCVSCFAWYKIPARCSRRHQLCISTMTV